LSKSRWYNTPLQEKGEGNIRLHPNTRGVVGQRVRPPLQRRAQVHVHVYLSNSSSPKNVPGHPLNETSGQKRLN